ncbi:hypothetical protein M3Y97_00412500 [Aphelenchoides bicaudatus]|nr:hypothetical protein M3Y97_00412500 [Aphelenchoides bicaudatus]
MSSKSLHRSVGISLIIYTAFLYLYNADWWIYGWLSALSGILLVWNQPSCPYWRGLTSIAIVFGTLETAFLFWSVRHVEKSAVIGERNVLPEGRHILISAIATIFTISSRLRNSAYNGLLDLTRTLVLVTALVCLIPIVGYSTCFYVSNLPYCHVFH